MVIPLTSILQMRAVYCENTQVRTSPDRKEWDFSVYYDLQLADAVKYILNYILKCIIKEECSDEGESKWKC